MQSAGKSEEGSYDSKNVDVSAPVDADRGSTEDSANEDYGSSDDHIFSDPVVADRWRQIYEQARYENRHRFDPDCRWTAREETKLVRTIDWRIMIWAWVMFCSMDLHRRNINRAISDNMLEEIGMNTNDFNTGQTIFLLTFLAAELPSGLISKKLGADRWIPTLIVGWSIVAGSQAFVRGKSGYFVIKALLGLLMGGFIPDIVLWLTYFYKSTELPTRLAVFWTALSTTRHWFRGKNGWFTEREEYIMVNRLLRDDPSKGDMNNRQAVGLALLWKVLREWEMWPLYIIGLFVYIPPAPANTYLSYILRQMGFSVFQANLLAIPSQFIFAVNLLIITWVSKKFRERALVSSISNIWIFPWILALVVLPPDTNPWVRYALLTGLLSYPYCHAILVGWNAKNSNAVRTRAVSAALYNMFVQAGNIAGTNIYRDGDKPLYYKGNKALLAITSFNIVLFYLVKAFYVWRNRVRDAKWNAMTAEEREEYVLTTKDEGLRRLDFRFVH
ncbi:hypothetical protein SLS62_002438 [Diatrype stigma]|uniref:Allantoate permease n=1 Tax=Diatrype stigma TaxID=117547 RepID=A0AAN9UXS8_9PEZI